MPMPRIRDGLLHSRVMRCAMPLLGWGLCPSPRRLIDEALGLRTQCVAGQTPATAATLAGGRVGSTEPCAYIRHRVPSSLPAVKAPPADPSCAGPTTPQARVGSGCDHARRRTAGSVDSLTGVKPAVDRCCGYPHQRYSRCVTCALQLLLPVPAKGLADPSNGEYLRG
jgi:hypothetical protein